MEIKTNRQIHEQIQKSGSEERRSGWIIGYIILAVICGTLYFLFQFSVFGIVGKYASLLQRLALAGAVVCVVFIITRLAEFFIARRSEAHKLTYNLIRLIRFFSFIIAIL